MNLSQDNNSGMLAYNSDFSGGSGYGNYSSFNSAQSVNNTITNNSSKKDTEKVSRNNC